MQTIAPPATEGMKRCGILFVVSCYLVVLSIVPGMFAAVSYLFRPLRVAPRNLRSFCDLEERSSNNGVWT